MPPLVQQKYPQWDFDRVEFGGIFQGFFGPRQTGKSTLLQYLYPRALRYDLFNPEEYERLAKRISTLMEDIVANPPIGPVIIDEIQKMPELLDQVQWLMEQFVVQEVRAHRHYAHLILGQHDVAIEILPVAQFLDELWSGKIM